MHFVILEKLAWLMQTFWGKYIQKYLQSMGIECEEDKDLSDCLLELNERKGDEEIIEIINAILMNDALRDCYRVNWNINFVYVRKVVDDMLELVKKGGYNVEDFQIQTEKILTVPMTFDFIEEEFDGDRFYSALTNEINSCYRFGFSIAANILIRKILENLLLDILRARYRPEVEMWFWKERGRSHDFGRLLQTLEENISDFIPYSSALRSSRPIELLKRFKQRGDASAHSIDVFIEKTFLDDNRDKINYLISLLRGLLERIS